MKTLNFLNRKGGVGKTVVSANIAYELARIGYVVLIIDLDSQRDITELFQCSGRTTDQLPPKNILNVLQNDCLIEDACVQLADNLYLVPGSAKLESFDLKYSQKALRDKLASEGLSGVDYVIIDNPPVINQAFQCGLVASDYVVVVTEAENPAMDNLRKLNNQLEAIRKRHNPDLAALGIVLNKVDQRRKLTNRHIKELRRQYRELVFNSSISIDTSIPNSIDQRIPVRQLRWRSRTVSQFQGVLSEILQRMEEKEGMK